MPYNTVPLWQNYFVFNENWSLLACTTHFFSGNIGPVLLSSHPLCSIIPHADNIAQYAETIVKLIKNKTTTHEPSLMNQSQQNVLVYVNFPHT